MPDKPTTERESLNYAGVRVPEGGARRKLLKLRMPIAPGAEKLSVDDYGPIGESTRRVIEFLDGGEPSLVHNWVSWR